MWFVFICFQVSKFIDNQEVSNDSRLIVKSAFIRRIMTFLVCTYSTARTYSTCTELEVGYYIYGGRLEITT